MTTVTDVLREIENLEALEKSPASDIELRNIVAKLLSFHRNRPVSTLLSRG